MSGLLYRAVRELLFQVPAEDAHHLTMRLLGLPGMARAFGAGKTLGLDKVVDGIRYKHPIGLAAGFDKNALYLPILQRLGFSFVEIGTVTPRPQAGNPKPRLFRLKADSALLNRMGFNNDGAEAIALRLEKSMQNLTIPVGVNIGKNKDTPNNKASKDYLHSFLRFADIASFFVVNVSSPNTPGLRDLQTVSGLKPILNALAERKREHQPIYVKIAPDLADEDVLAIAELTHHSGLQGLVITNTTLDRNRLRLTKRQVEAHGAGGISGTPLRSRATEVLDLLAANNPGLTLIASGGVMTPTDISSRLKRGADLVELYTGFIYAGPGLIKDGLNELKRQQSVS